jgi:flagellar hook-length control protein FliK
MRHPSLAAGEPLRPEGPGLTPLTDRPLSAGPGPTPAELQIVRRVHDPGWGEELGERVLWLIGRRESLAELRLDPPELGSLEIRIRQEKDATSVHILVQSGAAREALESALPRLRELFGEAGLSLQRLDVAERQAGQPGEGGRDGGPPRRGSRGGEGPVAGEGPWRPKVQGEGLIDTYA